LKPKVSTNLIKLFVRSKQEYALTSIADMGGGLNQTLEIAQAGALRRCVGVPPGTSKHEIFFSCRCYATDIQSQAFHRQRIVQAESTKPPALRGHQVISC